MKFYVILLFIIIVLLIGDLIFLYKIFKTLKKDREINPREEYFELKYNINLLKAITAILIFVIGFFGYNSYNNIKENIEKDIKGQQNEISIVFEKIGALNDTINNLEVLKAKLESAIKTYEKSLKSINNKINNINSTTKYNPKIYIVKDLKFSYDKSKDGLKIYFRDLKTMFGEKLPDFKNVPFINVSGYTISMAIVEITNEYMVVSSGSAYGRGTKQEDGNYYYRFDLWIASYE